MSAHVQQEIWRLEHELEQELKQPQPNALKVSNLRTELGWAQNNLERARAQEQAQQNAALLVAQVNYSNHKAFMGALR